MRTLQETLRAIGAAADLYAATIALTALTSIAARSPTRRRDARETLKLLLAARRR